MGADTMLRSEMGRKEGWVLLSYFLLCLGRTAADYAALENHGGGDCHAMILTAARL